MTKSIYVILAIYLLMLGVKLAIAFILLGVNRGVIYMMLMDNHENSILTRLHGNHK